MTVDIRPPLAKALCCIASCSAAQICDKLNGNSLRFVVHKSSGVVHRRSSHRLRLQRKSFGRACISAVQGVGDGGVEQRRSNGGPGSASKPPCTSIRHDFWRGGPSEQDIGELTLT